MRISVIKTLGVVKYNEFKLKNKYMTFGMPMRINITESIVESMEYICK